MSATSSPASSSSPTSFASTLQPYFDQLGAHAKSPYPAYALSSAFALAAPFSFAGGRDLQRLPSKVPGQAALEHVAGKTIASAIKKPTLRALPPYWQLVGFAFTIGGGGYIIDQGDTLNGSGVVTAWSLAYLFFYTVPSLRQPSPLSALLTASTLALGAGVHGAYYFSRTSWRGAIPGLTKAPKSDYGFATPPGSKTSS